MGRVRRSAADWREVLSAFEASGLSGVAFCQGNGIDVKSFYRARGKYGPVSPTADGSRFVSVSAAVQTPLRSSSQIELILPHCRVQLGSGVSPVWVAQLVKSLVR